MAIGAAGQARDAQHAGPAAGEWRAYGADLANTKYSAARPGYRREFRPPPGAVALEVGRRIPEPDAAGRRRAVGELARDLRSAEHGGSEALADGQPPFAANFKATPLMVGGRLYLNTPTSIGAAIDATTGEAIWIHNPKSYEAGTTTMSARWNQRGVA